MMRVEVMDWGQTRGKKSGWKKGVEVDVKRELSGMTAGLDLEAVLVEVAPGRDVARLPCWSERKAAVVALSARVEEMIAVMGYPLSVGGTRDVVAFLAARGKMTGSMEGQQGTAS